jgi:hypothetical protein
VDTLSIFIENATINHSKATSGERCHLNFMDLYACKLTWFENSDSASKKDKGLTRESFGANVSRFVPSVFDVFFKTTTISNTVVSLRRFMVAPSAWWLGLTCGRLSKLAIPMQHVDTRSASTAASMSLALP